MAMKKRIAGKARKINRDEFVHSHRKNKFYYSKMAKLDHQRLKETMDEWLEELYELGEDIPNNN